MRLRTFGGVSIEIPGAHPQAGPRPRSLALLAILAGAGAKGVTRERVMAVLWPDADPERARHALSQTLYNLRRDLGADVVQTAPVLRLDPAGISTDVAEFRAAVAAKRWHDAAELYAGPFLDGFHLADAPEFERWADAERAALATQGIRAIEIVAKESGDAGRHDEAVEYWLHLSRLDPVDPHIAASYMEALAARGDRVAALAHGRAHADLLRREFDAEPDAAVQGVMSQLRETATLSTATHSTATLSTATPAVATPLTATVQTATTPLLPPPSVVVARPRRWRLPIAAAAVVLVVAAALGARAWTVARRADTPVLAVGRIRDLAAPDSAALGAVLSEMLATSLGRLSELQVVANSRMLELTPRGADTSRTAFTDAARRAGATEIIEGELIPEADRRLRLEIRRVDVARGRVRGGYRVTGGDPVALFDSVTTLLAADLRVPAPAGSLTEVSTRSLVAYRFYEEGLRALYQEDVFAASRLFRAALREDSTFAMATYYAWRAARTAGEPDEMALAERALTLASRAPPRDRLLILTHVGGVLADPRSLAAAETLATNYPRDPEALVRAAGATRDLSRAVALIDRSIAIDSAADPPATVPCRLCDALTTLTSLYAWVDSTEGVERTIRRWRNLRPNDPGPWGVLGDWLVGFGRRAEADAALRRYDVLGGRRSNVALARLIESLRLDDLEAADRDCAVGMATADAAQFAQYRWYCAIELRTRGHYREARALLRDGRVPWTGVVWRGTTPDTYQAALVDMELGNGRAAADAFRGAYRPDVTDRAWVGYRARYTTWVMTLSATAAVEGGDTLRARALVDSIERVGRGSAFRRDPLLHHFVRGLLESRAGHQEEAVRELRAALESPTFGYTRINYELARSLLALRRPAEGIPAVEAALHGGLEGSGLYVSRTELHELAAQLFDANGQRDSAAVHYAAVERAWRTADPLLRPRYDAARAWLARASR